MLKALPVDVYRSRNIGDCTNGGVSSRFDKLLVLCDRGFINVDMDNPPDNLCKIVHRNLFGRDVYHIAPVAEPKGAGWMAGGNFAHTSDSRFSDMCGHQYGALAIHDRQETWEQYDILSR